MLFFTNFVNLQVPFNFTERGTGAEAAHNGDEIFGIDLALLLLVVQGEKHSLNSGK